MACQNGSDRFNWFPWLSFQREPLSGSECVLADFLFAAYATFFISEYSPRLASVLYSNLPPCAHPTMPGSQEIPEFDRPNAPKITHHLYIQEKIYFFGILVDPILYGTRRTPPPVRLSTCTNFL